MPETSPEKSALPVEPGAILSTVLAVLKAPADFFKSIKDQTGFQKPVVFSVIMYAIVGVCSLLWPILHGAVGVAITALVTYIIEGILTPFIGGLIIWVICMVFGSKATWDKAVPIAAYSQAAVLGIAVGVLIPISIIGSLLMLVSYLYSLYICYVGAKALMFDAAPAAKPAA